MADESRAGSTVRRNVTLGVFGLLTCLVGLSLVTQPSTVFGTEKYEVVAHVLVAGALTTAIAVAISVLRARPELMTMLLCGMAITILFELVQLASPNRSVQLGDLASGFAGVLLAATALEWLFRKLATDQVTTLFTAAALLSSCVIAALLFFGLGPESDRSLRPDGDRCPLTTLNQSDGRMTIGRSIRIDDRCAITEEGGLGLLGPEDPDGFGADNVLVSSELVELAAQIAKTSQLSVTVEITTLPELSGAQSGFVLSLVSTSLGKVMQISTLGPQIQVRGPRKYGTDTRQPEINANGLQPDSTHRIAVQLDETIMQVLLDDIELGEVRIGADWTDVVGPTGLTLQIGNHLDRSHPFQGTIEWIEIGP